MLFLGSHEREEPFEDAAGHPAGRAFRECLLPDPGGAFFIGPLPKVSLGEMDAFGGGFHGVSWVGKGFQGVAVRMSARKTPWITSS